MNTRSHPKTIQIFLPSGDPQGIRLAEMTTRIVQVIEAPRTRIGELSSLLDNSHVGIYFLIGESDEGEPMVYIGQTGDVPGRIASHNRTKDFWERVLVVVSKTHSLTQTHALFLEAYCLEACRNAGRFSDENGNSGSRPHTPAPLQADCIEIFETASTLLSTLGYPIFDPVARRSAGPNDDDGDEEVFYCRASGAEGRGQYTSEGFVVLAGSVAVVQNQREMASRYERLRQDLETSGVVTREESGLKFVRDHLFSSPSGAAVAILGRSANGWTEWKDEHGRTLDERKRQ